MELTDHDTPTAVKNNQGTFAFENNGLSLEQTGLSSGGFESVSVLYAASSTIPGVDDPNQVCELIAQCIDDDGCCLPDCVFEIDNDCDPGTARAEGGALGACSTTGGERPTWSLLFAGLLILIGRRRRGDSA